MAAAAWFLPFASHNGVPLQQHTLSILAAKLLTRLHPCIKQLKHSNATLNQLNLEVRDQDRLVQHQPLKMLLSTDSMCFLTFTCLQLLQTKVSEKRKKLICTYV